MSDVIEKFRNVLRRVETVAPESVSNFNDGASEDELAELRAVELLWYFDMDPADGGRLGQIVYEDTEGMTLNVIAQSFDDLLDMYVRDIEAGVFFADPENGQISSASSNWFAHPGAASDE